MKKNYEMDMCSGPILGKLLTFTIPLIFSGILQLLFNAADVIVVGRFAGSQSLAAVGSTTALINLMINIFIGLSVGVNVIVARYYGAKREKDVQDTIHTAMALSIVSGLFLIIAGQLLSRPMLELMGTPDDVIDKSTIYMRIIFIGMPANMIYNFGSAILRAVGDTKRPLYFLTAAGVINVVLNLFFRDHVPDGCGGSCLGDRDLSGDLGVPGDSLSDGERGRSEASFKRSEDPPLEIPSDHSGRPSGGDAGRSILDFQRSDPVLCEFLRLCRDGGKYDIPEY